MNQSSKICTSLYELARNRNGENVTIQLNDVDVVIIQRAEEADRVLRLNASNYRKNMAWLRQTFGPSRFSEDGRSWEIRRVLTQSYLNKFDREKTFKISAEYAQAALKMLASDSDRLDDDVMRKMTASVLVDNFFGVKLDDTTIDLALLAQLMEYGSEYSFVPPGKTIDLYRQTLTLLPELRRRVLTALKYFRISNVPRTSLLEGLLDADARKEDRVILEHELTAFMAAGSETSAATMGWACYLLARHPDLQTRLRTIAQEFWLEGSPSWKKLSTLQPLAAFISEALRLYPPTPIVSRFAIEADQLDDMSIQADQNIIVSFIGIHHDRRFRSSPWTVDIDASKKATGNMMAFGIGPRVCGGKHFALVELISFLSVFLDKASFELTSDRDPVFHWKSQLLHQGGQPVRVRWLESNHDRRH